MRRRLVPAVGVGFVAAYLFIAAATWMSVFADIRSSAGLAPIVVGTSLIVVVVLSWPAP